jgi:hypothetical protein
MARWAAIASSRWARLSNAAIALSARCRSAASSVSIFSMSAFSVALCASTAAIACPVLAAASLALASALASCALSASICRRRHLLEQVQAGGAPSEAQPAILSHRHGRAGVRPYR